jgi:hypothetical protein
MRSNLKARVRPGPLSRPVRAILLAGALVAGLGAAAAVPATAHASTNQTEFIPMYIYPSGSGATEWDHVCDTASTFTSGNTSTIVADPGSSGPTFTDSNYTAAIQYCANDNLNVIGYLDTNYGAVSEATLKTEIGNWVTYYPDIEGIMFDNVNASATATCSGVACSTYYGDLEAYADSHITAVSPAWVVGNPGTSSASTSWMSSKFDLVNVFEGTKTSFSTWTPPSWVTSDPQGTSVLAYGDTTAADAKAVCDRVLHDGMKAGFTSGGTGTWNTDPTTYWDAYLAEGC